MTRSARVRPASQRVYEVDLIKAVSIVAVVLIHSIRLPWDVNISPAELWIGHAASFAVPAFMAVSGFLWAGDRTNSHTNSVVRRLRRLLTPYVVVSLAIHALRAATGTRVTAAEVIRDLIFASTYDLYYYVFVAVLFVIVTPVFRQIPISLWPEVTVLFVAASLISRGLGWGPDAFFLVSLDSYLRNPLMFGGYFAIGWLARIHYSALRAWIDATHRVHCYLLGSAAVVCLSLVALSVPTQAALAAHWEYHYIAIAFLFVTATRFRGDARSIRFLSDSTYAIFLIHPVCIAAANRILVLAGIAMPWPSATVRFVVGLLGAIGITWTARRVLPGYSRDLIGA